MNVNSRKNFDYMYALICALAMAAGLAGIESGFAIAIGSGAALWLHTFHVHRRQPRRFALQVRAVYAMLLIAAWFDPLRIVYWLPAVGTWAYVVFGYCPLARSLSLVPAISGENFSLARAKRVLLARPISNILLASSAATPV